MCKGCAVEGICGWDNGAWLMRWMWVRTDGDSKRSTNREGIKEGTVQRLHGMARYNTCGIVCG